MAKEDSRLFTCKRCSPKLCRCPLTRAEREEADKLVLESDLWEDEELRDMGLIN